MPSNPSAALLPTRLTLAADAFIALLAVILGAFGAHALKAHLTPEQLASYETGVRYQLYHAFALIFVALLHDRAGIRATLPAALFTIGVLLFSGSIYLLATLGWKWLGPVTPLGGLSLMAGWLGLEKVTGTV